MRKILLIAMVCFGLLLMAGCENNSADNVADGAVTEGKIGDDIPVKRSQVAKMLALTVYDINTIENMERTIVFEDTSVNQPYDKYINAAFNAGLISGADETHFEPDTYLSLEQAQFLLNKLDKTGTLKLQYNHEDRKKPISASMWTEVFERALELSGNTAVISCNIVPFATGKNCSALGDRFVMTDRGLLSYECCEDFEYTDCTITVLLRDKEILAFKSVVDKTPSIAGAVVVSVDEEGAVMDMGGVERYFYLDNTSGLKTGESVSFKYSGNSITELERQTVENVSYQQTT